jgi:hypothetical protein
MDFKNFIAGLCVGPAYGSEPGRVPNEAVVVR